MIVEIPTDRVEEVLKGKMVKFKTRWMQEEEIGVILEVVDNDILIEPDNGTEILPIPAETMSVFSLVESRYRVVRFHNPFGVDDFWGVVEDTHKGLNVVRILNEDSPHQGKAWQIFDNEILETRLVNEL